METPTSFWFAPQLTRHKATVTTIAAIALGCSLYYLHNQIWAKTSAWRPINQNSRNSPALGLRRSNARRRRRQQQPILSSGEDFNQSRPDNVNTELGNEAPIAGEALKALLSDITQEQVKKDSYVHRKVTCNECKASPIRGIRYHCSNCSNYDLCEQCEPNASITHYITHVFYKIRIPAPSKLQHRAPEPLWYTGNPDISTRALAEEEIRELCTATGFQEAEVEALWHQFRCLATADWIDNVGKVHTAIDRHTFDKCLLRQTSLRPLPPNLIFDRMFDFYDQDGNGRISFSEFVHAVSILTRDRPDERQKRLFRSYDIDQDGFVDRKDFLRMFRAYYVLTKENTGEVLAKIEHDALSEQEHDAILGHHPISHAFGDGIPPAEPSRRVVGKSRDRFGDLRILDKNGVIDCHDDVASLDHTMAGRMDIGFKKEGHNIDLLTENIRRIYELPWPPEGVELKDIETTLGQAMLPGEVTEVSDQTKIRRTAHARLATKCRRYAVKRRQTIKRRVSKRNFYIDVENGAIPAHASTGLRDMIGMAGSAHDFANLSTEKQLLMPPIRRRIEEMGWSAESLEDLAWVIVGMLQEGWTAFELASDIRYHAPNADYSEAAKFVQGLFGFLLTLAPSSWSPSKDRPHDGVEDEDHSDSQMQATSTESQNTFPSDSRGSIEVPEPEKDVGQVALYQHLQEAFNELLDPIFILREDLALTVFRSKFERQKFHSQIAASVENPCALKRDVELYQKRWRTGLEFRNLGPGEDQVELFLSFMEQRYNGIVGELTAERCPRCTSRERIVWIELGGYCTACGTPSRCQLSDITEEPCPRCAERGEVSIIGGHKGGRFCTECGEAATAHSAEDARLKRILLGGDVTSNAVQSGPAQNAMLDGASEPVEPHSSGDAADQNHGARILDSPGLVMGFSSMSIDEFLAWEANSTDNAPHEPPPSSDPSPPQTHAEDPPTNDPLATQVPNEPASVENPACLHDKPTLRYFAALTLLEHEDKERGGPGRLNEEEFAEVMKGPKGESLTFLGEWFEMAGL